jgi:predicted alpha/beta hydrolase
MTETQANTLRSLEGRSSWEIAPLMGVSITTVKRWARELGVKLRGPGNRRPGILRYNYSNPHRVVRSVFELGEVVSE